MISGSTIPVSDSTVRSSVHSAPSAWIDHIPTASDRTWLEFVGRALSRSAHAVWSVVSTPVLPIEAFMHSNGLLGLPPTCDEFFEPDVSHPSVHSSVTRGRSGNDKGDSPVTTATSTETSFAGDPAEAQDLTRHPRVTRLVAVIAASGHAIGTFIASVIRALILRVEALLEANATASMLDRVRATGSGAAQVGPGVNHDRQAFLGTLQWWH
jgi:hypothetical protein